ncbi:GNAT family N-acetyltransferase [Actinomadura sp. ATCC 31491]|uniref:GNAT family N-acetyltransferase n=1 Tax=Actinomadura luzonensis TaxID=2805427 RepID=A0ABT0G986_9ACTN|nr:GNAT family N-acetyltransferase [Actinomadura luzonensis]MCK2221165.1 GNAT family N-acetyltransferase [Actinomadura luzonensis]
MLIREATPEDWPGMWAFMEGIVRAGETFSWDRDTPEPRARRMWFPEPPGRTFVAVDADGTVLGTANSVRNHGGGAGHISSASFMVDPARSGQGVGRALGEHVLEQARADGFRAMQFNAVVESNARAVALWRSLGFEVMATLPEGFHHPVHGYVGLHIMYRRL